MKSPDIEASGILLTRFVRLRFMRTQEVLTPHGVHPGQPHVIFALMKKGSLTQRQIAETIDRRAATITVMLSRMEESGLIKRDVSTDDRRCAKVSLTEKGQALGLELRECFLDLDRECFAGFSPEELKQMDGFLVRMNGNFEANISSRKTQPLPSSLGEVEQKEQSSAE